MTRIAFLVLFCLHGAAVLIPWQKTGEISGAVRFGCLNAEVCFSRDNASVLPSRAPVFKSGGYDGQFYYYAAYRLAGYQTVLDSESFRMARIGYPLLVSPFTAAGPYAVIAAMALIPFLAHLLAAALLNRGKLLFASNPFSVLSASLFLADGLAFSLAAMAVALAFQKRTPDTILRKVLVFALTALACLCKETALALPAAALALLLFQRRERRSILLYCVLGSVPLFFWWNAAGFSFTDAAMRGTQASGLLAYLSSPDAFFSGRGLLFVFFVALSLVWIVSLAKEGITGFTLFAGMALAAGAAASREYWDNFANVARLFFPAVPGLLFARGQAAWTCFFLLFSLLFLLKESRAVYPL
jgi:hypothetical protein